MAQQFVVIADNHIGLGVGQFVFGVGGGDGHGIHARRPYGLQPSEAIFDADTLGGGDTKAAGGFDENIGGWFAVLDFAAKGNGGEVCGSIEAVQGGGYVAVRRRGGNGRGHIVAVEVHQKVVQAGDGVHLFH